MYLTYVIHVTAEYEKLHTLRVLKLESYSTHFQPREKSGGSIICYLVFLLMDMLSGNQKLDSRNCVIFREGASRFEFSWLHSER